MNNTHRPIIITQNGEAKAVLLDTESFESMQKAIAMLKLLSQSEEDIKKENLIPQDKVFEEIEKKYFRLITTLYSPLYPVSSIVICDEPGPPSWPLY